MGAREIVPADERKQIVIQACEEIRNGSSFKAMAEKFGVPAQTLHRWVLSDVGPEYRQLQTECLNARIVEADEELDQARMGADIQRATAKCKFVRFDAERRLPHMWGPRAEITATVKTELTIPEAARRLAFILNSAKAKDATILETTETPLEQVDGAQPGHNTNPDGNESAEG